MTRLEKTIRPQATQDLEAFLKKLGLLRVEFYMDEQISWREGKRNSSIDSRGVRNCT
jgi:hypothetical protein